MLFAKEANRHWSTGRLEYVEVTHAGQAFRLGRYPIHFHLNGDVTGNYVRGCSIHHTFNRAVTIHAVHHLLVEHNVVYNVMGHAYFLEDGIETKNILQYNLAIFVKPASSLLNTDISPAAFWVTNPDNYIRHNAAAGGSHYGFWYNAPTNPGGPSFTRFICPRNIPILEFRNNTCHTHGRYGLWIYPQYIPKRDGICGSSNKEIIPAEFHGLTAWSVERGAEGVELGNVRFIDFLVSDAVKAGIEIYEVKGSWGGPMLKDSTIIGWSAASKEISDSACTEVGLQLPKTKFYTVDGVKFINFNRLKCTAIKACAYCKDFNGGFQTRFQNVSFYKVTSKTEWDWEHQSWYEDLDGTLSGESPGYSVLPYNSNLPPDHCTFHTKQFGDENFPGAICDDTVKFHRFSFNKPSPSSLQYKNVVFINQYGASIVYYAKERITHNQGWMVTLIDGETYNFAFQNAHFITNISYSGRLDDFTDGDYVILGHNLTQVIDAVSITETITNSTDFPLTYENNKNGDWYMDQVLSRSRSKQLNYLGKHIRPLKKCLFVVT